MALNNGRLSIGRNSPGVLLEKAKRFMTLVWRLTVTRQKHSPVWRQMIYQSVLYQTSETRRGISILHRWTFNFNGR
jgi:hypothetical protein